MKSFRLVIMFCHLDQKLSESRTRCLRTYEINSKVEKERLYTLKKLHEKMAHPAQVKLETLIKNAGKWMASTKKELGMIYCQCKTCKVLAKTPASLVVAMPRASTFNEVLTLDLKIQGKTDPVYDQSFLKTYKRSVYKEQEAG